VDGKKNVVNGLKRQVQGIHSILCCDEETHLTGIWSENMIKSECFGYADRSFFDNYFPLARAVQHNKGIL